MSANDWRAKMPEAPKLVHGTDGLVLVQLGEDSVLFPTEADARFFHAAYADVPNLANEVAHLRTQIDEGALTKALAQIVGLCDDVVQLKRSNRELQERDVANTAGVEALKREQAAAQAQIRDAELVAGAQALRIQILEKSLEDTRSRNTALAAEIEVRKGDEIAHARAMLHIYKLEADAGQATRKRIELEKQLAALAVKEAHAVRRARTLAYAVKHGITP